MKKAIVISTAFLLSLYLSAQVKSGNTQLTMFSFLEPMIGLKKYMGSEEDFLNPKNAAAIESHLKALAKNVKNAKHDPNLAAENYKFSRQVLEDHVSELERVFRIGNKSYARWMANSTLSICMSCHTQMPSQSRNFEELLSLKSFKSDFDRAEFLFSTRDFSRANGIYEKLLADYPESKLSADQLETVIHRQAGYYSRILRSPQQGAEALAKLSKNKNLPEYDRKTISSLTDQFESWNKIKLPDPKKTTASEIISFAKKYAGPNRRDSRLVSILFVSGILYDFLNHHPQAPETPEVLYWLAVCDREINNTVFYSLADLYLRECIIQYSASAAAAKCLKEYEENTIMGYTGSSGTHLPADVKLDLKYLKDLVEKKGKIEVKETSQ